MSSASQHGIVYRNGKTSGLGRSPSRAAVPGWDPYLQTGRYSESEFDASLFGSPGI